VLGGGIMTRLDGSGSGEGRKIIASFPPSDSQRAISYVKAGSATDTGYKGKIWAVCANVSQ
jgi:hypothetical protein